MSATPSEPDTKAPPTLKGFCPACNQRTMVKHCSAPDANCQWAKCTDKLCDAVIDFARRIGNAIDKTHPKALRYRLHYVNGGWAPRPDTIR